MRTLVLGAVVLVTAMAVGGGTAAVWTTASDAPDTTITAGNLDITAGERMWTETSTDVANPGATIDPAAFLIRRGDAVTMSQPFTTTLQGDNMIGKVSVDWSDPSTIPNGVSASYDIYDASGQTVGSTRNLGESLNLDETEELLLTDDDGRVDDFTVTVSLDFAGLSDRFSDDSTTQLTDLGKFTIRLDQVRTGGGQP
ncbi:MAG: hypothetical protein L0J17_09165 [Brevibacterium sp.]|nr:hypothetical protein [Brevibacterium sp.]